LTRRLYSKIGLFLLLLTIIVFSMPSSVFAYWQWRRVYVMVAYDEEWESTALLSYGYSATTLARLLLSSVSDRFFMKWGVEFYPITDVFWDSYDYPANEDIMMDEAIDETGFVTGVTTVGYITVDVLVAFTDQEIPTIYGYCYGYSDRELGVVLVRHAYPSGVGQATDNVLQHELSHLYNTTDEWVRDFDCIMNAYGYWIDFPYYYEVPTALTTTNWCEDCLATIGANLDNWGDFCHGGGSGNIYPVPYQGRWIT